MKFVSNRSGQKPKAKYFLRRFCGHPADTQYNTMELPCQTTALGPTHEPHHHFWTNCVLEVTSLASSQMYHWTFARLHGCRQGAHKSLVNKVLCCFIVCMSYQPPAIIILGHPPGSQQSVVPTMLADCMFQFKQARLLFLSVQLTSSP